MQMPNDPFGSMPSFAGPSGFAGDSMGLPPAFGTGMFGSQPQKKKKNGLSPWMLLSPMAGLMASHPGIALSLLSPGAGGLRALGAFR